MGLSQALTLRVAGQKLLLGHVLYSGRLLLNMALTLGMHEMNCTGATIMPLIS